jgi:hypothetical protein
MPSFCKVNKRPAEPVWIDGERVSIFELPYFDTYVDKVHAIIREADKTIDPTYRGVTIGFIHRALGDDVDRELTLAALHKAEIYRNGLIPERFTFKWPVARSIPPDEWPDTLTFGYQPHKWVPTSKLLGKRDR